MLIIPNRMRFNEKGFGSKINRNLFYPKKYVKGRLLPYFAWKPLQCHILKLESVLNEKLSIR